MLSTRLRSHDLEGRRLVIGPLFYMVILHSYARTLYQRLKLVMTAEPPSASSWDYIFAAILCISPSDQDSLSVAANLIVSCWSYHIRLPCSFRCTDIGCTWFFFRIGRCTVTGLFCCIGSLNDIFCPLQSPSTMYLIACLTNTEIWCCEFLVAEFAFYKSHISFSSSALACIASHLVFNIAMTVFLDHVAGVIMWLPVPKLVAFASILLISHLFFMGLHLVLLHHNIPVVDCSKVLDCLIDRCSDDCLC